MEGIEAVIPDYVIYGQRDRNVEWHLDRIDQQCLPLDGMTYNPYLNGSGVDIYIFDTGANFDHDELKDNTIFPGKDFIDETLMENQRGYDCNGHGTHVAALAGGKTKGVAPGATIIIIRVLNCFNFGPYSTLLLGIEYAITFKKQRAREGFSGRSIASFSLLGPADEHIDMSIQSLVNNGFVTVVAAGNYRDDACNYSPSRLRDVITVGGSRKDSDQIYWFDRTTNSPGTNYGPCVDLFAPGQWVNSAGHDCTNCSVVRSGTSMSTPLVAGAIAILLQANSTLGVPDVKKELISMSSYGLLNFSYLPDDRIAKQTPNRLLYIPSELEY